MKRVTRQFRPIVWFAATSTALLIAAPSAPRAPAAEPTSPPQAPASLGEPSPLPLPTSLSVVDYERQLFAFLNRRQYKDLGWLVDKGVRDTGPYLDGKEHGTHPAVRIYYSPEIIEWLLDGKRRAIPDGAMMVKEQIRSAGGALRRAGRRAALCTVVELDRDGEGLRRVA